MLDFDRLQRQLYTAVLCDALDKLGLRQQATRVPFPACTGIPKLMGRCKTTLWVDIFDQDPDPYDQELRAVDSCQPGEVLVCAAGGSGRSAIWGELLSTAALNQGCRGAIVHGGVRDVAAMREMGFPVFATHRNPYDSLHRQRVVEMDTAVEIDGVVFRPGDLVLADDDGIVVVPRAVEDEVLRLALGKIDAENTTRDAIRGGMKATEAYQTFGIL